MHYASSGLTAAEFLANGYRPFRLIEQRMAKNGIFNSVLLRFNSINSGKRH
jgi:hypothetical protein